jgi:polyisoprenoid-binding protein YceI
MTDSTHALDLPGYRPGTWKIDPNTSTIEFAIRQLATKARGRFTRYEVTGVAAEPISDSSVSATIDLASIDTGNVKRDRHLRGPAFLNVEKYPTMHYRSTGLQQTADGMVLEGELELHGTSRSVPLPVKVDDFTADESGNWRAGLSANGQISRRDFGLTIAMSGGGVVIADKISISLRLQAVRRQD